MFCSCLRIISFEAVQLILKYEAVVVHVLALAEVWALLICLHVHLFMDDLIDGIAVGVIVVVCHRDHARVRHSPPEAPCADLTEELHECITAHVLGSSENFWIRVHDFQ